MSVLEGNQESVVSGRHLDSFQEETLSVFRHGDNQRETASKIVLSCSKIADTK